ncbi:EsaB/YukD family protein [Streptococcus dentapri]|uniref:EsaB/YukD family protein n=1 Tax=Streptococcus dentapri TaxID=573564 RepID=A0ABV8CZG6_9STRE
MDLRIPRRLTVRQLYEELRQIYQFPQKSTSAQLLVVNKGLVLSETAYLSDYPITTGDYLRLEEF